MTDFTDMALSPHRRFNALTGSWVLVSPHRNRRPWQGSQEPVETASRPAYDPQCYLCPRNDRAGGQTNPDYGGVWVFDNDFPALLPEHSPTRDESSDELLRSAPAGGTCRVVCYSPRHDWSLADLASEARLRVISAWHEQYELLSGEYAWVQIFENRGEMMGCSNPHPHGQIWATDFIPTVVDREREAQRRWFDGHGTPLLLDYAKREAAAGERVVLDSRHWLVVVPWWAEWPFETLLLPKAPVRRFVDLDPEQSEALAAALADLQRTYDALFGVPFPYSMGWHPAPPGDDSEAWQLHAHFSPPLLRSATVRKFMVGFEMFAEPQRDLTPERAAEALRAAADSAAR